MAEQNKSNTWLIIGAIVVVLAVIYWFMSSGTTPEATAPAETGAATTMETPAAPADDPAVSVEPAAPATPAPADPAAPAGGTTAPAN
ncbi:hypothetical protein [Paracoccus shanxieyensis]|uniref:Dynamin n=1 Tax=Paracoccus shanxieyensis TaxID=2675752 RepID=A0A6L6ITL9_9RHOB|nr:hypothetical protein [Paracoccus shanxieyensis]MTH62692.1 hypothetical protein [Paracoccus shanxieyensis]MTH86224.1 hypothetical protein [Paracoccus shanxieyensis]